MVRLVYQAFVVALLAWFSLSSNLCTTAPAAEASRKGSLKKGFCVTTREKSKWQEKLKAIDAKWFYSWGANVPEGVPEGVEFVPMIWGKFNPERSPTLSKLKDLGQQKKVNYLMGFNEPDQESQSNIGVETALELWPKLEETGLPLCSPGCVHPDRRWMIDFMKEVEERNLRVDYVCVHSYGGPSAKHLVQRLRKVHKMYNRPIWITEFAVGDWQAKKAEDNRHSPEKVAQFMKELLPMLEKLDFVERYAWFSASTDSAALGTSALFHKDGSLTELGKLYRSF